MKQADFAKLFPEIANPNEYLPKIIGLCKQKNFPMDELQTSLHDFSLIRLNYPGYAEKPEGYLQTIISNKIKKHFGNNRHNSEEVDNIKDTDIIEDFDKKSLEKKLDDFSREIDKMNLPPNQQRLIDEMILLCQKYHHSTKHFMDEVQKAMKIHGVSDSNFRKILERLRGNIGNNDDIKGMLSFVPMEADINELINLMLRYMSSPNLNAYRFESEEMKKMLWLKELFENNSFTVGRFPEVYLDTFENFKDYLLNEVKIGKHSQEINDWYKQIANDTNWLNLIKLFDNFNDNNGFELTDNQLDFLKNNLTPDILGVYIFDESKIQSDCDCGIKYEEGKIILFQDRIEKISALISNIEDQHIDVIVDTLRFNVLMHELGHWLTHWARSYDINKKKNINWECGYYLNSQTKEPDVKTHEAMAQLISFWAAYDNPLVKKILLDYLTPTGSRNEYNKYLALIDTDKHQVLNKLKIIRTLCEFTDHEKYEFLISNCNSIQEFIAIQIYNEIRKNPLGDNIKLEDISRINNELLEHIFGLIRIEHKEGKSHYDFQIVIKKLNELNENEPLYKLWSENKKYCGEFSSDLAKGASLLKRFSGFDDKTDD